MSALPKPDPAQSWMASPDVPHWFYKVPGGRDTRTGWCSSIRQMRDDWNRYNPVQIDWDEAAA